MLQIQCFTFNDFYENTYIVYASTGEAIIIDAGCYTSNEENILKSFIAQHNLQVVRLVNTHCHLDHVFGNQFVKDTYQVKMYCHVNEKVILDGNILMAQMYGVKRYTPCLPDEYLQEGDKIKLGDNELEVLFLPGHSPGHIGLLNKQENWLMSGDVLFRESIGRTDFPYCNHQDLISSIKNKLFILPDNVTVYAGHGEPTTIGHEKKYNPFLRG